MSADTNKGSRQARQQKHDNHVSQQWKKWFHLSWPKLGHAIHATQIAGGKHMVKGSQKLFR